MSTIEARLLLRQIKCSINMRFSIANVRGMFVSTFCIFLRATRMYVWKRKKKKWKNNTKVFVLRDSIVRDLFFDVKHRFVIRPLLLENNILQYTAIQ